MKTDFEEIYSKIYFSDLYNIDDIRLLYVDRVGLRVLHPNDIHEKTEGMLSISRRNQFSDEIEYVEIPVHSIRVIIHRTTGLLLDRRSSYQGDKSMELPSIIFNETQ